MVVVVRAMVGYWTALVVVRGVWWGLRGRGVESSMRVSVGGPESSVLGFCEYRTSLYCLVVAVYAWKTP